MLVFCEDCGAKHTVDETEVESETFQLRCDVCNFLITPKSIPRPKIIEKPVDPTMELTCSHEILEFGQVGNGEDKEQTLILAAKDGRRVELTGLVSTNLTGNIHISPVSDFAFRVEVVSPSQVTGKCLAEYNGPGVIITDSISRYKKTIGVSFTRQ